MSDAEDDFYGNGWQQRRTIIDTESWNGKKGNIPVLKDQDQPKLEDLTLNTLLEVLRDVNDAVAHLRANPKVSYVIVDNFGNVSRSRMSRQRDRVELEVKRRQQDGIPYNPNRVVNFDLEDELELDDESIEENQYKEAQMTNVFDPEFYRQQAAYNAATAEKLEGIPLYDIFEVGQVIQFEKEMGGKKYFFAAIKIDTGWAMTGDRNGGYKTWQALLEFIGIQALDTVAVMVTTPELSLKKFAESKRQAKELEAKAGEVLADMSAKGQTIAE